MAIQVGSEKKIGILGYAGEEGVRRNQGRTGTSFGPEAIRQMMSTLAFHLSDKTKIIDYGDIHTLKNDMESSHDMISNTVFQLLQNSHLPVLLGGGHDLALAHGRGIQRYLSERKEKLGIINLDAHFDLRTLVDGKGHSGSPFYQLSQEYPSNFHYLCMGIQKAANPISLFERAESLGASWVDCEEFTLDNWDSVKESLLNFLDSVNKIYLSIDLDGFSSAFAPGVSAPSPIGFSPELAFRVFELIAKSKKLISMDVVELNPEFDQDHATARLAARCVEFILRKL